MKKRIDKYIKSVIVMEGGKEYNINELTENPDYMKFYGMACVEYKYCMNEINRTGCYLVITLTDEPKYRLEHPSGILPDRIQLGINPSMPEKNRRTRRVNNVHS